MEPSTFNLAPRLQGRRRIADEPCWRPVRHFTSTVLTPQLRTWLTDDGSLTARLMSSGQGEFSVRRLYQGWEVPLASERALLELTERQLALVREVALQLGGETVVFARSVFPIASLSGSLGHLRRLQNRSLGAILFRHPRMRRHPFELALMPGDCPYLPDELKQAQPAWGRRSRFEIAGKRLMVSEVFLSGFTPWVEPLPTHRTQRGKVSAAFRSTTQ
ncbi:MAG: chorismate lyase [Halioglobus sp.]|nr:chorismate lyase [Halioglobus sp.]